MSYIPSLHDQSEENETAAAEQVKARLTDSRRKSLISEIEEIINDEYDSFECNANNFLSATAANRAGKFLDDILAGDENAATHLFDCGCGRHRPCGLDEGKPWSHLIHGKLFETKSTKIRREIVEAHADLLRNERIKDLEAVVEGLSDQVRKLEVDLEQARGRLL